MARVYFQVGRGESLVLDLLTASSSLKRLANHQHAYSSNHQ